MPNVDSKLRNADSWSPPAAKRQGVVVSLVVPTRNRPDSLCRLLESLRPQADLRIELVIHDDASTPSVERDHGDLLGSFPRFRLLRGDRGVGAAVGRNRAWRSARGRWIGFLDDDCWCGEGHVQALLERIREAESLGRGYLLRPLVSVRAPGDSRPVHVLPRSREGRDADLQISTAMMLVRRDHLGALGGFDERLPRWQDVDLAARLRVREPPHIVTGPEVFRTRPPGISSDDARLEEVSRIFLGKYQGEPYPAKLCSDLHRLLGGRLAMSGYTGLARHHLRRSLELTSAMRTRLLFWLSCSGGRPFRWAMRAFQALSRITPRACLSHLRRSRGEGHSR